MTPAYTSNNSRVFGKRLKAVRLWMGLTQDKLGVLLGLDELTASTRISRYENGIHEPPIRTAQLIAATSGVPLAYFYCEDNQLADLILRASKFNDDQWKSLNKFLSTLIITTE